MSNGLVRVIVSVIAIPIILTVSYLGNYYFLFFALFISLISFYEFSRFAQKKGVFANLWFGLFSVFIIVLNTYLKFYDRILILYLIVAILSIIELVRNKGSALLNLGVSMLGISYIGFFSSALILIREFYIESNSYINGGYVIISMFAGIWICDSAAYYLGTAFGKHKLFPRVSPKKSWEGAVAGFIFAVITLIAAKFILLDFLTWDSIIGIGLIIGILGQIGDLIESLFKRDAEVKDSSNLVPGHGGIFDRFDSLLFSAPFVLILLEFFDK